MPTPRLPKDEANKRLDMVEQCLREGFYPIGRAPRNGKTGAVREALRRLGLPQGTSGGFLENAELAADRKVDWTLWKEPIEPIYSAPDGFDVKGTSTLVGPEGEVKGQWIKTDRNTERQAALMREAAAAMAKNVKRQKPVKAPGKTSAALCNLYTITDYHMGMLAWNKEGGDDWDIGIAQKTLIAAFSHMIASAPAAQSAVVCQLGDFLHTDGLDPVTPTHGHLLDVDGRFSKIVEATITSLRAVVDMALAKHEKVHFVNAEGNHDMASSIWLRKMFMAMYEKEPRLTVNDSELPYYVHRHGSTMLGFHHGHIKKPDELPGMFAAQFPEVWGQTTKRYVHSGHRHHKYENEKNGMQIVQHPTLAARDAFAARGGWHSQRQALAITYHETHGETGRVAVTPEMLDG